MKNTNEIQNDMKIPGKEKRVRWTLVMYDAVVFAAVAVLLLAFYNGDDKLTFTGVVQHVILSALCIFSARFIGNVYNQVWRYGGIQSYIRMLFTDGIAFLIYFFLETVLPIQHITFGRLLSLVSVDLLGALAIRMIYRYAYKCGKQDTWLGRLLSFLLQVVAGIEPANDTEVQKIKVAIVGAGDVGVGLAEELLQNKKICLCSPLFY